jgi:hypothetical protein
MDNFCSSVADDPRAGRSDENVRGQRCVARRHAGLGRSRGASRNRLVSKTPSRDRPRHAIRRYSATLHGVVFDILAAARFSLAFWRKFVHDLFHKVPYSTGVIVTSAMTIPAV